MSEMPENDGLSDFTTVGESTSLGEVLGETQKNDSIVGNEGLMDLTPERESAKLEQVLYKQVENSIKELKHELPHLSDEDLNVIRKKMQKLDDTLTKSE